MKLDIDFSEYKKFTNEEKELWNFEFKKDQQEVICKILDHAKLTNGRVSKNEQWRYTLTGAIILLSFLFSYLEFIK